MEDRESRMKKTDGNTITVTRRINSFSPTDYNNLDNLPTINGTEVVGDLTSADIKVLSENPEDYESEELTESEGYFTIVNVDGKPTKIPTAEIEKIKELAKSAMTKAEKAGTKLIGTKVVDGELIIVTSDYLDAKFFINEWGHLVVELGDSNAKQFMGRVVGGMFYSGEADDEDAIYEDIKLHGKLPLELDIYLCTESGNLWQYQSEKFVKIMTLSGTQIDELEFGTEITAELEEDVEDKVTDETTGETTTETHDKFTVNLLNKQHTNLSKTTVVMPYMKKKQVEELVDKKIDEALDGKISDKITEAVGSMLDDRFAVNEDEVKINNQNAFESWKTGQTESETLAVGGFAFADLPDFEQDDWETIVELRDKGELETYYNVGDVKSLELSTGEVVEMRISGFNHDGEGTMTLESKMVLNDPCVMDDDKSLSGGWANSKLYKETLPALLETFPEVLKTAIRTVKKKCLNPDTHEIEEIETDLYIPAAAEIYSSSAIKDCTLTGFPAYGELFAQEDNQLEYYKNLIGDLSPSTASDLLARDKTYWLRTACVDDAGWFWTLYRNGHLLSLQTNNDSVSISICFVL